MIYYLPDKININGQIWTGEYYCDQNDTCTIKFSLLAPTGERFFRLCELNDFLNSNHHLDNKSKIAIFNAMFRKPMLENYLRNHWGIPTTTTSLPTPMSTTSIRQQWGNYQQWSSYGANIDNSTSRFNSSVTLTAPVLPPLLQSPLQQNLGENTNNWTMVSRFNSSVPAAVTATSRFNSSATAPPLSLLPKSPLPPPPNLRIVPRAKNNNRTIVSRFNSLAPSTVTATSTFNSSATAPLLPPPPKLRIGSSVNTNNQCTKVSRFNPLASTAVNVPPLPPPPNLKMVSRVSNRTSRFNLAATPTTLSSLPPPPPVEQQPLSQSPFPPPNLRIVSRFIPAVTSTASFPSKSTPQPPRLLLSPPSPHPPSPPSLIPPLPPFESLNDVGLLYQDDIVFQNLDCSHEDIAIEEEELILGV